jgi:membrane-associated protease RseP (regulator of RpoE activity)
MITIVWNLLSFVVALAILIAVHEWGHFWVARRCGRTLPVTIKIVAIFPPFLLILLYKKP